MHVCILWLLNYKCEILNRKMTRAIKTGNNIDPLFRQTCNEIYLDKLSDSEYDSLSNAIRLRVANRIVNHPHVLSATLICAVIDKLTLSSPIYSWKIAYEMTLLMDRNPYGDDVFFIKYVLEKLQDRFDSSQNRQKGFYSILAEKKSSSLKFIAGIIYKIEHYLHQKKFNTFTEKMQIHLDHGIRSLECLYQI
jgi:hypothetical protein